MKKSPWSGRLANWLGVLVHGDDDFTLPAYAHPAACMTISGSPGTMTGTYLITLTDASTGLPVHAPGSSATKVARVRRTFCFDTQRK